MPLMRDKKGQDMTPGEKVKANNHVRLGFSKLITLLDKMLEKDFHYMNDEEIECIEGVRLKIRSFDKKREQ